MLKPDKIFKINGVTVREFLIHNHNDNDIKLPTYVMPKIIGVTIHNTNDLKNVEDDAEQYTRATYNGNMRNVRVHYYIDDIGAWQNMEHKYQNWSCADGNGQGNSATISLECIMNSENGEKDLKARDNCARIAAYLLDKFQLSEKCLYTHTHWLNVRDKIAGTREELNVKPHSYKNCPFFILPDWENFEKQVAKYMRSNDEIIETPVNSDVTDEKKFSSYVVRIIDPDPNGLNVRKAPDIRAEVVTTLKKGEAYTIIEEITNGNITWGKLKSGVGYISLHAKYVEKI